MPAINISDRYQALQYDGSNGTTIASTVTNCNILSQVGGTLVMESPAGSTVWTITTNQWVRFTQNQVSSVHTPTEFALFYIQNAVYGDLSALQTQINALAAGSLLSAGIKEAPTLVVGAQNITVDLTVALDSTSHTAHAQVFAPTSLLGQITVGTPTVASTTTVTVPITNNGIIGLNGARILVTVTA